MPRRDSLAHRYVHSPEFSALHKISVNADVFRFFAEATRVSDEIFQENHGPTHEGARGLGLGPTLQIEGTETITDATEASKPTDDSWYNRDDFYYMYDHSTVWVGVLEASTIRKNARTARRALQAKDVGLMKQEAKESSSKTHPNIPMRLLFDSVTLVGHKQPNGNARGMQTRIALVPNLEHHLDTTERLFTEYDIITEFLKRHLRQSFLPDDYTPHAEFMKFRRGARRSDIKDVLAKLKEALAEKPLLITLKELELPEPEHSRKRKKKAKQENQK